MAEYWASSLFAFLVEVHKDAKRERGHYLATLTELAWSIKKKKNIIWHKEH